MKIVIILAIAFVLLIPFSAFAQSLPNCPNGSFAKAVSGGGVICVDNLTREQVQPITPINEIQIEDEPSDTESENNELEPTSQKTEPTETPKAIIKRISYDGKTWIDMPQN